jgi:quaternary ammonium compound-resistance protein SugE
MAWCLLVLAGLFEVAWAVGIKYTAGFTRWWPSVFTVGSMAMSVLLLAQAIRTLPLGTAYAIWTGIGAVGVALLGMLLFNEPHHAVRLLCIALIVTGIVGLQLTSGH